jgi:Ca2+-binding EF-hand superfamily protein
MGILSKGKIEDKLKLAFDIYDYNDDGFIEKKEAETIVSVRITTFKTLLNLF